MVRLSPSATAALAILAIAILPIAVDGQAPTEGSAPPSRQALVRAGAARLYNPNVLHRIAVTIAERDLGQLMSRDKARIPCTFTFDGRTLRNVGVRQSGGIFHPYQPITNKPSLSLKFDEFVDGQTLFDLDKLVLKNELQDISFLSEHLTYEIFRRAGLAAPLTAFARVTINGIDSGIYLMREPIDKEFLVRNFGLANATGNLYEIENVQEFVFNPEAPTLDDEGKNGRTRRDLVALAAAVRGANAATFVTAVSPLLDIDRFVTFIAAEVATGHWDGLTSRNNNTYVYARPRDGKFIFIPYGADQALGISRRRGGRGGFQIQSALVQKFLEVPELRARVEREVARIGREPIWNVGALITRVEQAARVLSVTGASGRTAYDLEQFQAYRSTAEAMVRSTR